LKTKNFKNSVEGSKENGIAPDWLLNTALKY